VSIILGGDDGGVVDMYVGYTGEVLTTTECETLPVIAAISPQLTHISAKRRVLYVCVSVCIVHKTPGVTTIHLTIRDPFHPRPV